MTADQYREITIELLNHYIVPFYMVIGGIIAVIFLAFIFFLVIKPLIRRF